MKNTEYIYIKLELLQEDLPTLVADQSQAVQIATDNFGNLYRIQKPLAYNETTGEETYEYVYVGDIDYNLTEGFSSPATGETFQAPWSFNSFVYNFKDSQGRDLPARVALTCSAEVITQCDEFITSLELRR